MSQTPSFLYPNNRSLVAADVLDLGGLALQTAQVIELRTAHLTTADDLDMINAGRMQRERALYADAVADAANREGFAAGAVAAGDYSAFKLVDSLDSLDALGVFTNTRRVSPTLKSGRSVRSCAFSMDLMISLILSVPPSLIDVHARPLRHEAFCRQRTVRFTQSVLYHILCLLRKGKSRAFFIYLADDSGYSPARQGRSRRFL